MFLPKPDGNVQSAKTEKYVFREAEDFMMESTMEALFTPFSHRTFAHVAFAERLSFLEKCLLE